MESTEVTRPFSYRSLQSVKERTWKVLQGVTALNWQSTMKVGKFSKNVIVVWLYTDLGKWSKGIMEVSGVTRTKAKRE